MQYIIPAIFILVFVFAVAKKVRVYDEFSEGVKEAFKFTMSLIPCLAAIFMMCELFEVSRLSDMLTKWLAPVFSFLGIPPELTKLVLIKPFSGSGSLAYLTAVINEHGADSYISRCACVLYGSSETVFYITLQIKHASIVETSVDISTHTIGIASFFTFRPAKYTADM